MKFRLYIAGDAPHSNLARANLDTIGKEYLNGDYQVEIIDLTQAPQRFLQDDILVTPTLIRYWPEPVCVLIGNLNNRGAVVRALGLDEQ